MHLDASTALVLVIGIICLTITVNNFIDRKWGVDDRSPRQTSSDDEVPYTRS